MNVIRFYRTERWLYLHKMPILSGFIGVSNLIFSNTVVPYKGKIGEGTKFAYGGMECVVHKDTKIDARVTIGLNTSICRLLEPADFPTVCSDVCISSGVRIIGNIYVGKNVIIGKNAVVNRDVEDNCIVAGVPERVFKSVDCSIADSLTNKIFPNMPRGEGKFLTASLLLDTYIGTTIAQQRGIFRNGGLSYAT